MMIKAIAVFPLVLLATLIWTCGVLAIEWEYIYEGDILPDDPSLGDKVAGIFKTDGINTSDVCKITPRGELHIDDPGDKVCFFLPEAENLETGTIEARVKVLSQSGATYTILFGIEDVGGYAWLDLFPDHIQMESGPSYNVDMTEYHILRIAKDGIDVTIYLDDEEVLQGATNAASDRMDDIIFGAGSTGGTGEHYWDYVVFTSAGAFAPDELPNYFIATQPVESKGKSATCWGMLKSR